MPRLLAILAFLLLLSPPLEAADLDSQVRILVRRLEGARTARQRDLLLAALDQTAGAGSSHAAEVLAKVHGKGLLGLSRDPKRARAYVTRAARLGSPAARQYLARRRTAPVSREAVQIVMMDPDPPAPAPRPDPSLVHRAVGGRPASGIGSPLADLSKTRKVQVFSSPHCPPCRAFEPVIRAYCSARDDLELEILDITTPAGSQLARQFDVEATPTTLFLGPSGQLLTRILGFRTAAEVAGLLGETSS